MLGLIYGANWAEILTAAGTLLIGSGVIFAGIQVRDTRLNRFAEIARELVQQWDSPTLVRSRMLIKSHGPRGKEALEKLKVAFKAAEADQTTSAYYLYTRYLNFFERVGVAFKDDRRGLAVVDQLFGGSVMDAWETWHEVIDYTWGPDTTMGANFGILANLLEDRRAKAEARQRWRSARREELLVPLENLGSILRFLFGGTHDC
jgi:hypothetical protein